MSVYLVCLILLFVLVGSHMVAFRKSFWDLESVWFEITWKMFIFWSRRLIWWDLLHQNISLLCQIIGLRRLLKQHVRAIFWESKGYLGNSELSPLDLFLKNLHRLWVLFGILGKRKAKSFWMVDYARAFPEYFKEAVDKYAFLIMKIFCSFDSHGRCKMNS